MRVEAIRCATFLCFSFFLSLFPLCESERKNCVDFPLRALTTHSLHAQSSEGGDELRPKEKGVH